MDNISAVLYNPLDLRLEQKSIPEPKIGEVLIAMRSVGICGSDIHYWTKGQCGSFKLENPMVLGHESSGKVVKIGPGVTSFAPGDRVALEPGIACGLCWTCKTGQYNLCTKMQFAATPPCHGTLTRFFAHPAQLCFKLPDEVSFEEGALLEPLSVAVHACRRAPVEVGNKVLVCGAGSIGLLTMMTAKTMGAAEVWITDIQWTRVEKAKKLGADVAILIEKHEQPQKLAEMILKHTAGQSPNVTIECSGAEISLQTAIYITKPGGVVVNVGRGPTHVSLPLAHAITREVDIKGTFRYANCYPVALSLVTSGQVDLRSLVSHRFSLEQTVEAFEKCRSDDAVKVMITV